MIGLGITYEVAFLLSGVFAFAAVILGGELPLPFALTFLIPFISLRMKRHRQSLPLGYLQYQRLVLLATGGIELYRQGIQSIILAFSITFVLLLSIRLCAREKPEHDLQSLLLGLFYFLLGRFCIPKSLTHPYFLVM